MTISSDVRIAGPFNGNGSQTAFPFAFKVFTKNDLMAVRADAAGAEYTLVLDSDFSVTLNVDQDSNPGGTVTYPISGDPLPSGQSLTLTTDLPFLQPTDITNAGGFYPQVIEDALDRNVVLIQQISQFASRALRLSVTTPAGVDVTMPRPVANNLLGWDADAQSLANFPVDTPVSTAVLRADLLNNSDAARGDAIIGVKKGFLNTYPTTVHETNERGMHLCDFLSPSEMNSFYFGGPNSFDASPGFARMRDAARISHIKRMKFSGRLLLNGTMGPDGMRNGILFPLAPTLNANPLDQLILEGDGGGSSIRCGATNMIAIRVAANFIHLRNFTIEGGGLSGTWCVGAVPEDMNQTTTLVNQSFLWMDDVNCIEAAVGAALQPGPRVLGADSGAFYNRISGGYSNQVGVHHWSRKGSTWAVDANRITRTIIQNRASTRGNCAYLLQVGSEVMLIGCNDEQINQAGFLATPTARRVEGPCSNITFIGGYSENCTESFWAEAHNVTSYDYQPLSGSDLLFNKWAYSYDAATNTRRPFTPLPLAGTSGAPSANTSVGIDSQRGLQHIGRMSIAFDKGTMSGVIALGGFPFEADSALAGNQGMEVLDWTGITFPATAVKLCARMAGASTLALFFSVNGGGTISLNATHLSASVTMTIAYEVEGA